MPNSKKSQNISLRLFLDGVETRIIGATVSQRPSQPDTASIKVPPHPAIEGIKEKTLVHIFYKDEKESHKKPDKQYNLLFEGQVSGSQTQLNQSGQNKVIQAQSIAGYLTQTKVNQTFLSGPNGLDPSAVDIRSKVEGEDVNFADRTGTGGEIRSQISQEMLAHDNLTDGAYAMMSIIFEHNSFLRDVMRRMRILDRFPALGEDVQLAINDFIENDNASKLIHGAIGQAKSQYPVLALINNILKTFFYQMNLNSTILNTFNPVPDLINSPPPACNILTPEDFSNLTFSENHQAKPTREALSFAPLGNQSAYIWPPTLDQPFDLFDRDDVDDVQNFENMFTNEELTKGPRPHVSKAKKRVAKGKEKDDLAKNYYMNKASYNFDVARRNANNLKLSGRFNPEPFPGFTSFVVAPSIDVIFGELTSVTHSIDNQNNTATTSYEIGMPYKLLTNPDNLNPPQTNPALTMSEQTEDAIPIDKLNKIYNTVMNDSFDNNAKGTWGEQGTLSVTQSHMEKYFNGRFDSDKYKDNQVLKRAVVAMGQYLNPNSFIGEGPGDSILGTIKTPDDPGGPVYISHIAEDSSYDLEEILEANSLNKEDATNLASGFEVKRPGASFGGENFHRRAHPDIEMVFKDFYKAGKINSAHSGTSGDIWDLYNSEEIDYINSNLKEGKEHIKRRISILKEDKQAFEDRLENLEEGSAESQRVKSKIIAVQNKIRDKQGKKSDIEDQLDVVEDEGEKPVLLKTEYLGDYDLKGFLQNRQDIIRTYNEELTKSDGSIVGNMDIFTNEILEDDEEENNDE